MEIMSSMDTLTIPNVDDNLKQRLKLRAAKHGQSIEVEAGDILRSALGGSASAQVPVTGNIADAIRAIVEPLGGIELEIAPRKPIREPPKFAR
jgi:plasmid stability protein